MEVLHWVVLCVLCHVVITQQHPTQHPKAHRHLTSKLRQSQTRLPPVDAERSGRIEELGASNSHGLSNSHAATNDSLIAHPVVQSDNTSSMITTEGILQGELSNKTRPCANKLKGTEPSQGEQWGLSRFGVMIIVWIALVCVVKAAALTFLKRSVRCKSIKGKSGLFSRTNIITRFTKETEELTMTVV